jgi:hypothetical protein
MGLGNPTKFRPTADPAQPKGPALSRPKGPTQPSPKGQPSRLNGPTQPSPKVRPFRPNGPTEPSPTGQPFRPNGPTEPSPGLRPQADALGKTRLIITRPEGAPELPTLTPPKCQFDPYRNDGSGAPSGRQSHFRRVTQGIGLAASALGYARSARWAEKAGDSAWFATEYCGLVPKPKCLPLARGLHLHCGIL